MRKSAMQKTLTSQGQDHVENSKQNPRFKVFFPWYRNILPVPIYPFPVPNSQSLETPQLKNK